MSYIDVDMDYEKSLALRKILSDLLDSEGWKFVLELIDQRVTTRKNDLYSMVPSSIEQMVTFARIKGAIDELELLPHIIAQMYSDVDTFVAKAQSGEEEEMESAL